MATKTRSTFAPRRHDEREDLHRQRNEDRCRRARSAKSAACGRPAYEETDFHQLEEDRWAHAAAEEVNKRVLSNDFDALAIIAPPKTLGVLRKKLHKEAERRLVCEIPKEMTGRPIPDIEACWSARRKRRPRPFLGKEMGDGGVAGDRGEQ